jgi:hypothetical protein
MTSQPHYHGKINPVPSRPTWLQWVPAVAFLGGMGGALAAAFLHHRELALGLVWGSVLTVLNFYSLKILTEKLVGWETVGNRRRFWSWNLLRWACLALGCWALLSVSPVCLGGAFLSYLWLLVVLSVAGLTFSKPKEGTSQRSKFF